MASNDLKHITLLFLAGVGGGVKSSFNLTKVNKKVVFGMQPMFTNCYLVD